MGLVAFRSAGMTALRRARSTIGGAGVVLAYHRFASDPLDPMRLNIDPARFEEQVRSLADRYNLITLADLFTSLERRTRIPERSVAITIDDGYADALLVAAPVLARFEAPATVFVSSGYLGIPHGFWWDELEHLLLRPGVLPVHLDVRVGDIRFERTFSEKDRELDDVVAAGFRGWDFTQPVIHGRQRLYLGLSELLNPLNGPDREAVLTQLREQIAVANASPDAAAAHGKRPLTREELLRLNSEGLVDIGGHTTTHLVMSRHPLDVQRTEVTGDKRALEKLLGGPVTSFAYPHGGAEDYSRDSVACVRDAGFLGACTTRLGALLPWGSAGRGTDRFQVPRTTVPDVSGAELVSLVDKRLGL